MWIDCQLQGFYYEALRQSAAVPLFQRSGKKQRRFSPLRAVPLREKSFYVPPERRNTPLWPRTAGIVYINQISGPNG